MAITAVYFRFTWHMRDGADFPMAEAAATLCLTFGGVVRESATLQPAMLSAAMLLPAMLATC
jgi:hypothetical protein